MFYPELQSNRFCFSDPKIKIMFLSKHCVIFDVNSRLSMRKKKRKENVDELPLMCNCDVIGITDVDLKYSEFLPLICLYKANSNRVAYHLWLQMEGNKNEIRM